VARNETFVNAPRDVVWSVLCDPYAYPRWVVGTDRTVDADDAFPAPDAAFRVRFPLGFTDLTHSREIEEGRRIVLDAGGGPGGAARVDIRLADRAGGTHVTLLEEPTGPLKPLRALPPVQWLTYLRNVEALRRFRNIAERRVTSASTERSPQPTGR
jgi:uncharacterized protein YndB with AHSA1/START domain